MKYRGWNVEVKGERNVDEFSVILTPDYYYLQHIAIIRLLNISRDDHGPLMDIKSWSAFFYSLDKKKQTIVKQFINDAKTIKLCMELSVRSTRLTHFESRKSEVEQRTVTYINNKLGAFADYYTRVQDKFHFEYKI